MNGVAVRLTLEQWKVVLRALELNSNGHHELRNLAKSNGFLQSFEYESEKASETEQIAIEIEKATAPISEAKA